MPKHRDLRGQKFHHLTPIEYSTKSRWVCRCDCGELTKVYSFNLISGRVKSCGCQRLGYLSRNKELWAEFMKWRADNGRGMSN